MGGTTNATDNFQAPAAATTEVAAAIESGEGAVINEESQVGPAGHVHGPDCGHDHAHEEAPTEPPKGRYLDPSMIPGLNLLASFDMNNSGPIWRKSPQELLTNISVQAALVPEGGVKLCFVNNEAYKFLLALGNFRKKFTPASAEQQKKGIVGLFDTHVVIICDALWDQGEQVTLHKAIYFCDEVVVPTVEITIETAVSECTDAACTEHGSQHYHPVGEPAGDPVDAEAAASGSAVCNLCELEVCDCETPAEATASAGVQ